MAKQRAALLLNLRREYQGLFLAREIATLSQMAAVLEMSQEKLTQLWTELPLEDAKIAALLQFTVDSATSYQYAKIRTESVDPAVKRFI